jgi:hypothetical protein
VAHRTDRAGAVGSDGNQADGIDAVRAEQDGGEVGETDHARVIAKGSFAIRRSA